MELLIKETDYLHYACATIWDKNYYIPFPFWPIKHHIGKVKSVNCVFSKYPLKDHERIIFDKPKNNPFGYNWGYLDRGLQKVVAQVGHKEINLVNLHLEAWDADARQQ